MIEEDKRELQKILDQGCQILDDQNNKTRQFEENIKDSDKNSLILSRLFEVRVIGTKGELLPGHNDDEQIKIEEDTYSNLISI